MAILRKALIVIAVLVLVVIGGLAALYGVAVAMNRHDRPPSAKALELAAASASLPAVADGENGYVFVLGLDAPPDADPMQLGTARAAEARRLDGDAAPAGGFERPPAPPDGLARPLEGQPASAAMVRLSRAESALPNCSSLGTRCFERLEAASDRIEAALAESSWAVERYLKLLEYPAWLEVGSSGPSPGPRPKFSIVNQFHELRFLDAWTLARRGDAAAVERLLDSDLTFWRRALTNADMLITKAVIAHFIQDYFVWSNAILERLPQEARAQAIPDSWRAPIADEERSFERVVAGEWRLARNRIFSLKTQGVFDPAAAAELAGRGEPPLPRRQARFLQPQDFANRYAERLGEIADAAVAPYAELPRAFAALRAKQPSAWPAGVEGLSDLLYDPLGDIFLPDLSTFIDDAEVVADLEGVRRAALLAAELRAAGASARDVPAAIAGAELRNPYTDEPFGWLPDEQAIVFVGQSHLAYGRVALRY
ncbi:MAG TPA: hypothetical protein VFV10_06720 [Gammaproteobacteria bacterium]|nr:hypothetical protein [Gammaproteobacteria bacterium]